MVHAISCWFSVFGRFSVIYSGELPRKAEMKGILKKQAEVQLPVEAARKPDPFHLCLVSPRVVEQTETTRAVPHVMTDIIFAVMWACDETGNPDKVEEGYQKLLKGLVTSMESKPEEGVYMIAVPSPMRAYFEAKKLSYSASYGFIHFPEFIPNMWQGKFHVGETHSLATWLCVVLSNPKWTLQLDPRYDGGICLNRPENNNQGCSFYVVLKNPKSLGKLSMREQEAVYWRIHMGKFKSGLHHFFGSFM